MDKEWVEKMLRECVTVGVGEPYTYAVKGIPELAEAIAAQHEAEIEKKDTVLRELDTAVERLCAQREGEIAELKAQMAAMGEALEHIRGYAELRMTALSGEVLISGMATIGELADKALSAAPEVVYSGEAPVYRTGEGEPWLDLAGWKQEFVNGTIYGVLVLAHEQPQSSEQEE